MASGRRRRALAGALLASVVAVGACAGDGDDTSPAPTSTTAPAPDPQPAEVAAPAPPVAPLTGAPATEPELLGRPALVVKIDNAPKGRPQAGINQADVVFVEKVEDGITRLFVVFHSSDADPVGPVRSARSTDIVLAGALNNPLFSYSGTNATFQALVDRAPLVDVGINKAAAQYRRLRGRPAPYNLFSTTSELFGRAQPGAVPPPSLFRYRSADQPEPAGGTPAAGAHVEYRGANITTTVDYAWDPAAAVWRRAQSGTPHVDAAGEQVSPRNVIVQLVDYVDTGQRDTAGTPVPEASLLGEGDALVLTAGRLVPARWSRASESAVTTYVDAAGAPVGLTPGQTWVELAPPGAASVL